MRLRTGEREEKSFVKSVGGCHIDLTSTVVEVVNVQMKESLENGRRVQVSAR